MHRGYVKDWRRILEWEWYTDYKTCHLFRHCILRANIEDKQWKGQFIKKGSFVTSLENLSRETGLSVQNIRTSFKKLTSELTIKTTTRNTIISVKNYENYQGLTSNLTNNQQTTNKQLTTTKEIKEIKELKEDNIIQESENFIYLDIEEKKSRKKLLAKTIDKIYCSPFRIKEEQKQTIEWILADKDFKECISPILAYFKNHYKRELEDKRIGEKINGLNWLFYNPQNYFLVKQTFEQEVKNGTIHYTV